MDFLWDISRLGRILKLRKFTLFRKKPPEIRSGFFTEHAKRRGQDQEGFFLRNTLYITHYGRRRRWPNNLRARANYSYRSYYCVNFAISLGDLLFMISWARPGEKCDFDYTFGPAWRRNIVGGRGRRIVPSQGSLVGFYSGPPCKNL